MLQNFNQLAKLQQFDTPSVLSVPKIDCKYSPKICKEGIKVDSFNRGYKPIVKRRT